MLIHYQVFIEKIRKKLIDIYIKLKEEKAFVDDIFIEDVKLRYNNNKEYYDKMGITEDYLFKIMKIRKMDNEEHKYISFKAENDRLENFMKDIDEDILNELKYKANKLSHSLVPHFRIYMRL